MTFTPPTDNLYKFAAISGVLLLITSVVLELQTWDRMIQTQEKISGIVTLRLDEKARHGDQTLASQVNTSDRLPHALQDDVRGLAERRDHNRVRSEVENLWLAEVHADHALRIEHLNADLDFHNAMMRSRIDQFKKMSLWLWSGGITFMALGFGLWFIVVQRREDALLRLRVVAIKEKARLYREKTSRKS